MSHSLPQHSRLQARELVRRLKQPRKLIQVISGARQVGKTTLVRQVVEKSGLPTRYASADEPTLRDADWVEQQWEAARILAGEAGRKGALLVLDEVQKVTHWPAIVKRLWNADTRTGKPLRVILTGSAPLLLQRELNGNLAGRFEVLHLPHWSFSEMREVFGWSLEQYLFYGACPGAAPLIKQPARWARYILDSLIETAISRDVLLLSRVYKPASLRRVFEIGCAHSGQVFSYSKILGQLQNTGNTATVAHYLELLAGAGLVTGLPKYTGKAARRRASSPKLQVLNTGLITAQTEITYAEARKNHEFWGRLVESAVGAHLANAAAAGDCKVYYWREDGREVNFIVNAGGWLTAIEVTSGRSRRNPAEMAAFSSIFGATRKLRKLLVGGDGMDVETFLAKPVAHWLKA